LGLLVRLRFASRSPAMWRVCAIALSFVSGWRAFSSVSLCTYIFQRGLSRARCVGLGFLVRLRFASRSLAMCRVCAIALSFVSGWRAFSSVSLCKYISASVARCRGNASLCRSGAYVATRAAGRTPMRGLARPSAGVVSACLAPCVWVWGAWFGFALRCVALLCGVFVRLHLALFPAGGPFLPSLYVQV
jgi:hypothetical protein